MWGRQIRAERERALAGIAVGATILAWFGVMTLVFYVPRLTVLWAELDQRSASQRLLATLCNLTGHNFVAVAPVLLAATGAAFWWRVHASRRVRSSAHLP